MNHTYPEHPLVPEPEPMRTALALRRAATHLSLAKCALSLAEPRTAASREELLALDECAVLERDLRRCLAEITQTYRSLQRSPARRGTHRRRELPAESPPTGSVAS